MACRPAIRPLTEPKGGAAEVAPRDKFRPDSALSGLVDRIPRMRAGRTAAFEDNERNGEFLPCGAKSPASIEEPLPGRHLLRAF